MNKQINFFGPINYLGYGIVFMRWMEKLIPMLKEQGIASSIICPSNPGVHESELTNDVREALVAGKTPDHSAIGINLWHLHDMSKFCGSVRIGYPIFEMPILSAAEINSANNLDTVWVTSEWAKKVVERHSDTKCQIIPCGVDVETFSPKVEPAHFVDDYFHTFVTLGKFEKRKGHELILESMRIIGEDGTDTRGIPIRLLISCTNPFVEDFSKMLKQQLNSRGFYLNDKDIGEDTVRFRLESNPNDCVVDIITVGGLTCDSVAEIYNSGDTGLFPYFAEGWNLPLLECMACGVPCISTRYSGPTEYLNDNNHITLSDTKTVIANDGKFFHGNAGTWEVPTISGIIKAMTKAITDDFPENISTEGRKTAIEFSWENAAKKTMEALMLNEHTQELFKT